MKDLDELSTILKEGLDSVKKRQKEEDELFFSDYEEWYKRKIDFNRKMSEVHNEVMKASERRAKLLEVSWDKLHKPFTI